MDIPVLTFPQGVRSDAAELDEMEMPALAGHSEPIICDPRHNDSVRQSTANCIGCERDS